LPELFSSMSKNLRAGTAKHIEKRVNAVSTAEVAPRHCYD
jgi:hypothetical protein